MPLLHSFWSHWFKKTKSMHWDRDSFPHIRLNYKKVVVQPPTVASRPKSANFVIIRTCSLSFGSTIPKELYFSPSLRYLLAAMLWYGRMLTFFLSPGRFATNFAVCAILVSSSFTPLTSGMRMLMAVWWFVDSEGEGVASGRWWLCVDSEGEGVVSGRWWLCVDLLTAKGRGRRGFPSFSSHVAELGKDGEDLGFGSHVRQQLQLEVHDGSPAPARPSPDVSPIAHFGSGGSACLWWWWWWWWWLFGWPLCSDISHSQSLPCAKVD